MLNPVAFHDVVSGRRRDLRARAMRCGLQLLEPAYAAAVAGRNLTFDWRLRAMQRVAVPVISVGNLTTGGTGKTPFVAWLARGLRERSVRVALVSRGYRAEEGARNDEALELELQLPDVPHVQNADRVAAAQLAIEEFESQCIVLDDAFQHRRLHRDLDIVLIDALNPFGFGHLLPRGLLRESLSGLRRAHVIGLSRVNLVDAETRAHIWSHLQRIAPGPLKIEIEYRPDSLRASTGASESLKTLREQPVLAFCGIGNPAGFQQTLLQCGFQLAGFRAFPDHHPYDRQDLERLADWSVQHSQAAALVCTEKDLVKLGVPRIGQLPLWALRATAFVSRGEHELQQRLDQVLGRS